MNEKQSSMIEKAWGFGDRLVLKISLTAHCLSAMGNLLDLTVPQ